MSPIEPLTGPLAGIKVLDLSRVLAGPWSGQMLGDLGADVIKVEQPGQGDDTRKWGPPFLPDGSRDSAYYLCANRNKRSVAIDIAKPEGQDLVRQLAAQADIVLENFRVGGLAKYGLDYPALKAVKPDLIYCSITGFGQTGPDKDKGGLSLATKARAMEGGDDGAGVFAFGVGVEVEEGEEEKFLGWKTEAGAKGGGAFGGAREGDRVRHREDGKRGLHREGGGGEVAGRPNLVVVIESGDPGVGEFGEFPGEVGDVVFPGAEALSVVVVEIAGGGRIEVDDVDVVGIPVGEAGGVGLVAEAVFAVKLEGDEGGGEAPLAVGRGEDERLRFRERLQGAEGDEPRGVAAAKRTGKRGQERGERERGEPAEGAEEKKVFVGRHEGGDLEPRTGDGGWGTEDGGWRLER